MVAAARAWPAGLKCTSRNSLSAGFCRVAAVKAGSRSSTWICCCWAVGVGLQQVELVVRRGAGNGGVDHFDVLAALAQLSFQHGREGLLGCHQVAEGEGVTEYEDAVPRRRLGRQRRMPVAEFVGRDLGLQGVGLLHARKFGARRKPAVACGTYGPPLTEVPAAMAPCSCGVFTPHRDLHIDMALS